MLLAVSVLFVFAARASGDIPKKINYQGKVTDSSDLPLVGPHSIVFSIYEAADGGSSIWSETTTVEADSSGVFSAVLGSVNPIEVSFAGARWLEVTIDGQVLKPRRELASVPYAYQASNAEALGGRPAEDFADSSVDGHSLDAADGNPEDAVYVDDYGRVGIGTSTPATFLDVRALGSAEGGVSPYGEVLGHFRISGSDAHSAVSIDAQSGKDAILYFAQSGASMWDLRNDTDIGDKFQLRWHRGSTVRAVTVDSSGYVGIATTTPNGPLQVQSNLSINSGTHLTDRVAPLVVGDGDGTNPCLLIDGNQIEQADTTDLVFINYNSPADVSLAQGGGNVGIGTSTPNGPLHIESNLNIGSGANLANRVAPVVVGDGDGTSACILIDGNQIDQANPSSGLYINYNSSSDVLIAQGGGNVGIATATPNGPLQVESGININNPGATNFADRIAPVVIGDGDGTGACILIDGNQVEQANPSSDLYINFNSSGNVLIAQGGGDVGVGTSDPGAKLEVAGQVKITGGSPGEGKVLTSSSTGVGTWKAITTEYYISPLKAIPTFVGDDGYYSTPNAHLRAYSVSAGLKRIWVPIDIPGKISGVPQKVKSLTVYYLTDNSTLSRTTLYHCPPSGSLAWLIDDDTDRTSSTYTSFTLNEATPPQIQGSVSLLFEVDFDASSSIEIGTIVVTTTD